jgi:hypothetical protein
MTTQLYTKQQSSYVFLLGIFALCAAIISGHTFLSLKNDSYAKSQELRRYNIGNVGAKKASIFFITENKNLVSIRYGTEAHKLTEIALDSRETIKASDASYTHLMDLVNLKPDTKYYFVFVVGNSIIKTPTNEAFTFTTLKQDETMEQVTPIIGQVLENNKKVSNAIIIITANGVSNYPIITTTKNNGDWLAIVEKSYSNITKKMETLEKNTSINIEVVTENKTKSTLITTLDNAQSLPLILKTGTAQDLANVQIPQTATVLGSVKSSEFTIFYPKNNTIINSSKPLIKGKASANTPIHVSINSPTFYETTTIASEDGSWNIELSFPLQPGLYILYVKNTITQEIITSTFTIAKSGEQVLAAESTNTAQPLFNFGTSSSSSAKLATPSATLVPTRTITLTPTPSLIIPTPTAYIVTPTPSQNVVIYKKEPPVSGSGIQVVIGSLLFIIIGFMFWAFS